MPRVFINRISQNERERFIRQFKFLADDVLVHRTRFHLSTRNRFLNVHSVGEGGHADPG